MMEEQNRPYKRIMNLTTCGSAVDSGSLALTGTAVVDWRTTVWKRGRVYSSKKKKRRRRNVLSHSAAFISG